MSKIAVVCAQGIGDALILSIASNHLQNQGHDVTTFSKHLPLFGNWLKKGSYEPVLRDLTSFDAILLQHDNAPASKEIISLRQKGMSVYSFYTNYRESKHGPLLAGFDFPFDEEKSMVDNTCRGTQSLLGGNVHKSNALHPPPHLSFRKYPKRIAIHPTSSSEEKNWPRKKFLKLFNDLKERGFDPAFILPSEEVESWPSSPKLSTLSDLASFLYESGGFIGNDSGPAHLASYLCLPHLVIFNQERRSKFWRPDWRVGQCAFPSRWIPNFKGLRLREKNWKKLITNRTVLRMFITSL